MFFTEFDFFNTTMGVFESRMDDCLIAFGEHQKCSGVELFFRNKTREECCVEMGADDCVALKPIIFGKQLSFSDVVLNFDMCWCGVWCDDV